MIMVFGTVKVNVDTSNCFFFIFVKFSVFGLFGKRAKNCPKLKNNNYNRHVPYLRNSVTYDHDEVLPRWAPEWNFLKFRSACCWKIYFRHSLWLQKHSLHIIFLQHQQFFLELKNFIGSFLRLSFITQFKIEFLRPFTGCRKVLGKMSDTLKSK